MTVDHHPEVAVHAIKSSSGPPAARALLAQLCAV